MKKLCFKNIYSKYLNPSEAIEVERMLGEAVVFKNPLDTNPNRLKLRKKHKTRDNPNHLK